MLQSSPNRSNTFARASSHTLSARKLESRQSLPEEIWPYQTFITKPDFHPPVLEVSKTKDATEGLFFLTPSYFNSPSGPRSWAPLIMTERGDVVWHGSNTSGPVSADLRVQQLDGEDVLVYWNGYISATRVAGHGMGVVKILDSSYKEMYTVGLNDGTFVAGDGVNNVAYPSYIDLHEAVITTNGTILVDAYNATPHDLSSVGGQKNGWLIDSQLYEIDIKTNKTIFKWSSLDHIAQMPLNQSYLTENGRPVNGENATDPWEYFGLNSAIKMDDGYLISARMYSSIYALAKDGSIKWQLQGISGGDFELGPGAQFRWQHYVRPGYSSGDYLFLHMFNNDNGISKGANGTYPSTGLSLFLDLRKRTATVVSSLIDPKDVLYVRSQGDYQPLDNNHVFLAYGEIAKMKEFDQHGDVVMDVQYGVPYDVSSYRIFLQQWSGHPATHPLINATSSGPNSTTVYMSWNGATPDTYDSWLVYGGGSNNSLSLVANVSRTGFETNTTIGTTKFVQVGAAKGPRVLSKSRVIKVS